MGFIATAGTGTAFKRVPQGVHVARCVKLIDLGTQPVEFNGETKMQHKLQLVWEVLGDDDAGVPMTSDDNEPLQISKRYTLSLHAKSRLRADLEAWRGKPFDEADMKGFDVSKLLGAYCMLNIVHSTQGEKTYANVSSITPLPRQMPKPASTTPLVSFNVDDPDMALFATFHEKLQQTIQNSDEWKARTSRLTGQPAPAPKPAPGTAFDDMDSDIPF